MYAEVANIYSKNGSSAGEIVKKAKDFYARFAPQTANYGHSEWQVPS